MSRLRLIETAGNILDLQTETSQDWIRDVDTKTPLRLWLISVDVTPSGPKS